ncbi:hypothetical protein IQ07DRAFT_679641 [Pyrenochaeta sp. DS3sAY3a]|nr:hypothetical protein IQ07DRAFT_679641 [Pyrenochaeta sp. DS3sAY3a]
MASQHSFPSNSRSLPHQAAPSSNANMNSAGQTRQTSNPISPFLGSDGTRLYPNMLFCPGITKYPLIRFIPVFERERLYTLNGRPMIHLQDGSKFALDKTLHCGHCYREWSSHPGIDRYAHGATKLLTCTFPCVYCSQSHPEKLCPRVYVSRKKLDDLYPWPANVHPPAHIRLRPTPEEAHHLKNAGYMTEDNAGFPQFTQAALDIALREETLFRTTVFADRDYESDLLRESATRGLGYHPSPQPVPTVENYAAANPIPRPASRFNPPMYRSGSHDWNGEEENFPSGYNDGFAQPQRSRPPSFDYHLPMRLQVTGNVYFGTVHEGSREWQPQSTPFRPSFDDHMPQPIRAPQSAPFRPEFDDQMPPPTRAPLPVHGYYMPADYESQPPSRSPERQIKSEMLPPPRPGFDDRTPPPSRAPLPPHGYYMPVGPETRSSSPSPERRIKSETSPPPTPQTPPRVMSSELPIGYMTRRQRTEYNKALKANRSFDGSNSVDDTNVNGSNTNKRKTISQASADVDSTRSLPQSQPLPEDQERHQKKPKFMSQRRGEVDPASLSAPSPSLRNLLSRMTRD